MEIKEDNFNYSNLKERIKDYSHQDKVRCGIYCSELVIDIYESNYDSKSSRFAIEAAKDWVKSPTEDNSKAAYDAAEDASIAAIFAGCDAASLAAFSAAYAAYAAYYYSHDSASASADAAFFASCAASAAVYAAEAGGENVKFKIISWFRNNDKK